MRGRGQGLEPTPRVRRGGHKSDGAETGGAGLPEVWAVPIETICDNIFEGEHAGAVEVLHHRCGQLGLALPRHLVWHLPFRPPRLIGVGEPWLRQEQPFVDQRIALPRRIGGKDAHLTVLHLAQRAAILAGHPDGVLPFFREPRLIDDQHPIRLTHLVLEQAVIGLQHDRFIPERVTDEALHRPDLAAFHLPGHRFDRFAFERAELTHHRVEKLVPRLLPGKTPPKGGVEPTELVHEGIKIAPCKCKLGNSKRLPCRPTCR